MLEVEKNEAHGEECRCCAACASRRVKTWLQVLLNDRAQVMMWKMEGHGRENPEVARERRVASAVGA